MERYGCFGSQEELQHRERHLEDVNVHKRGKNKSLFIGGESIER